VVPKVKEALEMVIYRSIFKNYQSKRFSYFTFTKTGIGLSKTRDYILL